MLASEKTGRQVGSGIHRELEEIRAGLRARSPELYVDAIPIFGRIGAISSLYRSYYERFLAASGLTHAEYQVLGILRGVGARSPTQLARSVGQTTAGMTKTLDRLERGHLVARGSHPSDRRRVEVSLTDAGASRTDALQRDELAAQAHMLSDLGPDRQELLRELLDRVIEQLVDAMPR